MERRDFYYCLWVTTLLIASNKAYEVEQPQLQLNDQTFRLSIEADPDIQSVEFNVNINEEFFVFEEPQYSCIADIPRPRSPWSCEFRRKLQDNDVVYTWLMVKHGLYFYRSRKAPISVGALRRGERNYLLTTTSTTTTLRPTPTTSLPCEEAITVLRNKRNLCKNDLIFEDNFDQLNNEYWTNEIRIPTTRLDSEFVIYNGSVEVNEGILKITASLTNHGIDKLLDLGERCTSRNRNECLYEPRLHHLLPPVKSGRINSAKYLNFIYGKIEVRAKVPKGDWLFPLITLQPSSDENGLMSSANGEIRIAFVRGNLNLIWNNASISGDTLFGGPIFSLAAHERHQFMSNVTISHRLDDDSAAGPKHFGNKFHNYSLLWAVNELSLMVDGVEYGKIKIQQEWKNRDSYVPFQQMFYMTLGLAAGGHGDFPENVQNKPWENTDPKAIKNFYKQRDNWIATWTQPSLEIDYVRVYAV